MNSTESPVEIGTEMNLSPEFIESSEFLCGMQEDLGITSFTKEFLKNNMKESELIPNIEQVLDEYIDLVEEWLTIHRNNGSLEQKHDPKHPKNIEFYEALRLRFSTVTDAMMDEWIQVHKVAASSDHNPKDPQDLRNKEMFDELRSHSSLTFTRIESWSHLADYMDCKSFNVVLAGLLLSIIEGKTPDEIRAALSIENDFTPEEYQRIQQETSHSNPEADAKFEIVKQQYAAFLPTITK